MVYSKEEILTEAAFCYDVTKVLVASNMMYESYSTMFESAEDEDAFMEAGKGMIGTISTMISAFLKKVSETFQRMVKDFNDKMKIRKIKKSLTPELRARMIANTGNKIKVVDVSKVLKLAEESDKFVEDFVGNMNKRIDSYIRKAESGRLSPKQMKQEEKDMLKYCQAATNVYNKLVEQIDDTKRSPRTVTVDQYFEIIEKCGDYSKALQDADKSLQKNLGEMEQICRRLESIMKTKAGQKAAGSMLEAGDESPETPPAQEEKKSIIRRAIDSVKRVVSSVFRTINNFMQVHSKLSMLIGAILVSKNFDKTVHYVSTVKGNHEWTKERVQKLKKRDQNEVYHVGKDGETTTVGDVVKDYKKAQRKRDAKGVANAAAFMAGNYLIAGGAASQYDKHLNKKAAKEIARRERAEKRYAEEGI